MRSCKNSTENSNLHFTWISLIINNALHNQNITKMRRLASLNTLNYRPDSDFKFLLASCLCIFFQNLILSIDLCNHSHYQETELVHSYNEVAPPELDSLPNHNTCQLLFCSSLQFCHFKNFM